MNKKPIRLLLLIPSLAALSLACGTLNLGLVEKDASPTAEFSQAPQQLPPNNTGGESTVAGGGESPSTRTEPPVPTQMPSVQVHAEPKTTLPYPGWSIAWTPDGKWLLLGERVVHILDAQTLQEARSIQADRWVEGLAVSPDSRTLAMIDESRGVMLFDIATGTERLTLPGTRSNTTATSGSFLAFSPDGATLAVIVGEVVKLYRVSDGAELNTLVPKSEGGSPFFSASALAFSKDGARLFVGGSGIAVLNAADGKQERVFGQDTRCMTLSPDGSLIVSAGTFNNQPVTIWEADTGRQLRTLTDPGNTNVDLGVSSMAFTPDGRVLATASSDVTVKLWDVATGALLQSLVGHTSAVSSLAVSPDGTTLASGTKGEGDQAGVRLWTISSGPAQPAATRSASSGIRPTPIPLSARAILPENASTVKKTSALNVSESGNLVWSPTGTRLIVGGRRLHFIGVPGYAETNSLSFELEGLAVSPDGSLLAAAGYQGVTLFDMAAESELRTLPGTSIQTSALSNSFLAFTPDGATLAVILGDVVKLFDTKSGAETGTIVAKGAFYIAISPDGTELYAAGWGQQITVWDMGTGAEVRTIGESFMSVDGLILSPDGSILATSSFDGSITLYEAATGRQLRTLKGSSARIGGLSFSPDGRIIASVADEVTIQMWEVSTGRALATLTGHSQSIRCIAFSPDGALLASSSYGDGVYLWGLPAG